MKPPEDTKAPIEQAGQDLFDFAIAREDTKWLVARLPEAAELKAATVEYELQILKIISVGWSIAYFLEEWPQKKPLENRYWEAVRQFSQGLSSTTEMMIGQEIDYFQTLKDRLAAYVEALRRHPEVDNPAEVIGPEFARACGNRDDLFAVVTGGRLFSEATRRVRDYLQALDLGAVQGGDRPLH
jgi:hypothetical protein